MRLDRGEPVAAEGQRVRQVQDEEADISRTGQIDGDTALAFAQEAGKEAQTVDDDIDGILAVALRPGVQNIDLDEVSQGVFSGTT